MPMIIINERPATSDTFGTPDFSEEFSIDGRRDSTIAIAEFQVTAVEIPEVPDSFLRGMADFQNGRTVDFENVLNNPPPRG